MGSVDTGVRWLLGQEDEHGAQGAPPAQGLLQEAPPMQGSTLFLPFHIGLASASMANEL